MMSLSRHPAYGDRRLTRGERLRYLVLASNLGIRDLRKLRRRAAGHQVDPLQGFCGAAASVLTAKSTGAPLKRSCGRLQPSVLGGRSLSSTAAC